MMENSVEKMRSGYENMNKMAQKGGVVFFGSDMFYGLSVGELSKHFDIDEQIYNRSVPQKTIHEMQKMADVCVLDLEPDRVFVNIGEVDLKEKDFDMDRFISEYEWILYTLHIKTGAKIYVVSVVSDEEMTGELNERLQKLSSENGCSFVDVSDAKTSKNPQYRIFDILKYYIRYRKMNFGEAMCTVNYK